jgi:hypothetical protein
MFPGYFALVMATGVVSIACQLLAMPAREDADEANQYAYHTQWHRSVWGGAVFINHSIERYFHGYV